MKIITKHVAIMMTRNGRQYHIQPFARNYKESLAGVKLEHSLRERIQVVQSAEDDIYGSCKIEVVVGMVDVFHQVPSTTMAEHQAKDNQLAPVLECLCEGKQPTKAAIYQVSLKKHPATNVSIPSAYFKGWGSASSLHP